MPRAKRRHNGEGQLWVHAQTGRLAGRVSVRDALGRDHRKTVYQRWDEPKQEFMQRFDQHRQAMRLLRGSEVHRATVGDLIAHWLQHGTEAGAAARVAMDSTIKRHISPMPIWNTPAASVRPTDITAYYTGLKSTNRTDDNIWRVHRILRAAYHHAIGMQMVERDPMAGIKTPKNKWESAKALTQAEQAEFFAAAKMYAPEYFAYLYAIAGFRARPSEVAAMNVADLVLDQRVPYVRNRGTKTRAADRATPITSTTAAVMREHLIATGIAGMSKTKAEQTPLFKGPRGKRLTAPHVGSHAMPMIRERLNWARHVTLYDLRATGVTRLVEAGVRQELRWQSQGHTGADAEASYIDIDPVTWEPELRKVAGLI